MIRSAAPNLAPCFLETMGKKARKGTFNSLLSGGGLSPVSKRKQEPKLIDFREEVIQYRGHEITLETEVYGHGDDDCSYNTVVADSYTGGFATKQDALEDAKAVIDHLIKSVATE